MLLNQAHKILQDYYFEHNCTMRPYESEAFLQMLIALPLVPKVYAHAAHFIVDEILN